MRKKGKILFCVVGLMWGTFVCAATDESALLRAETIKQQIAQGNYEQALQGTDMLRTDVYDLLVRAQAPVLRENVYCNPHFALQIANPVSEWQIQQMTINDEVYKKQKRFICDLVVIENIDSPYGLAEQCVVSAYDIGNASDTASLAALEHAPEQYLKSMAQQMLEGAYRQDIALIEKQSLVFKDNPAYRIVLERDMGYDRKVRTINMYVFVRQYRYILVFSFVMEGVNYSIYTHVFDAILETVRFGAEIDTARVVPQQSFTDLYLERARKT